MRISEMGPEELKRMILAVAVLGMAALLISVAPDIRRYMRMRAM